MNLILPAETNEQRRQRVRAAYWLPTQERWIKSKARLKLMQKTRKDGGMTDETVKVIRRAMGMKVEEDEAKA